MIRRTRSIAATAYGPGWAMADEVADPTTSRQLQRRASGDWRASCGAMAPVSSLDGGIERTPVTIWRRDSTDFAALLR
jgi:hypothetical protein